MTDKESLGILSMNVRGFFSDSKKRKDVFNWVRNKKASIICLQETHSTPEVERFWESEWGYKSIFCSYTSSSAGVAVLFRNNFEFEIHTTYKDPTGRFVVLDITANHIRFTLVNLYGPNSDNPEFFQSIFREAQKLENMSIVFCGDWNVIQEKEKDTFNVKNLNNPKAHEKIKTIKAELELCDPWRIWNEEARQYTWRRSNPIIQSRIDYFLVSDFIFCRMLDIRIIPGYRTDHSAIFLKFKTSESNRGKGYWKFNSQLLFEDRYIEKVKQCIRHTIEEYMESGNIEQKESIEFRISNQLFWEILKMKIRSISLEYSSIRAKTIKEKRKALEKEILLLESKVNASGKAEDAKLLEEKNQELQNSRSKYVEGLILRSKATWYEMGEKNSEYFCKLEKRNFVNKTISELIDSDGNHFTDQSLILAEQVNYFANLYKSKTSSEGQAFFYEDLFLKHNIKLTNTQNESCIGCLKLQECSEALRNMKNKKSPGSDGFTAEFYKCFWKDIGWFVCRSLNEGYQNGKLSQFQSQGIITCIPKEEKDRRYIKNWRPISLLNVDYKIGSSSIANRFQKILPSIISDTQKGFIKGRFIGENTRFLYDLIDYLKKHQKPGLLLLLDFEKAFDSLEWNFITKALKSFNFGESIIKWFLTLYSSSTSAVINNGNVSKFFSLERGCRQGDPLAPYIFILTVELLAISIKENINITGITVNGKENKIGQYADDSFLTLDGSEKTLRESMSTIDKFGVVSGLRLNISKSQAIWLGSKSDSEETLCEEFEIKWENKEFKLLGITFTKNLDDMVSRNYYSKIKSIKILLASWMKRDLTPIGKITIIKTLALPKLIHLFSALPDPSKQLLDEINKIFFKFIWGYKVERLKRNTIVGNYDEGGLNMVHLSSFISYIKLKWVKRYLSDNEGTWQNMLHSILNLKCVDFIFYLSKEKLCEFVHQIDNIFWKDVFRALTKI